MQLCKVEKKTDRLKKYSIAKLKVPEAQKFKIKLRSSDSAARQMMRPPTVMIMIKIKISKMTGRISRKRIKRQLKRFWGFGQGETNHGLVLRVDR